jgi:hypothetical protein
VTLVLELVLELLSSEKQDQIYYYKFVKKVLRDLLVASALNNGISPSLLIKLGFRLVYFLSLLKGKSWVKTLVTIPLSAQISSLPTALIASINCSVSDASVR